MPCAALMVASSAGEPFGRGEQDTPFRLSFDSSHPDVRAICVTDSTTTGPSTLHSMTCRLPEVLTRTPMARRFGETPKQQAFHSSPSYLPSAPKPSPKLPSSTAACSAASSTPPSTSSGGGPPPALAAASAVPTRWHLPLKTPLLLLLLDASLRSSFRSPTLRLQVRLRQRFRCRPQRIRTAARGASCQSRRTCTTASEEARTTSARQPATREGRYATRNHREHSWSLHRPAAGPGPTRARTTTPASGRRGAHSGTAPPLAALCASAQTVRTWSTWRTLGPQCRNSRARRSCACERFGPFAAKGCQLVADPVHLKRV